eukprot:609313-Amphidinium_carterae.2
MKGGLPSLLECIMLSQEKIPHLVQQHVSGSDGLVAGDSNVAHFETGPIKLCQRAPEQGMVSTFRDYLRFLLMIRSMGELDSVASCVHMQSENLPPQSGLLKLAGHATITLAAGRSTHLEAGDRADDAVQPGVATSTQAL